MKSIYTLLLFSLTVAFSYAQKAGLIIEYNVFDNELKYYSNGLEVEEPVVKEGQNIYVVLKEYNRYIYEAELKSYELNYNQAAQNMGFAGGSMGSSGISGIGSLLGGLSIGGDIEGIISSLPQSRGVQEEVADAKSTFSTLQQELKETETKINQASQQIQLFQQQRKAQKVFAEDASLLKENDMIRPSRIEKMLLQEIYKSFAIMPSDSVTIDDVLQSSDQNGKLQKAVINYNTGVKEYAEIKLKWNDFSSHVNQLSYALDDPQLNILADETTKVVTEMEDEDQLNNVNVPVVEDASNELKELLLLRRTYEELQNDVFTYKFTPIQATDKEVELKLVIKKKNEEGVIVKELKQIVPIYGTWKIVGGLGFSFGRLFNETYSYSLVRDTIVSAELDAFTPLITSFVHVYRENNKNFNVGGSFGLGFPIQANDGIQSLSFFLGPTLLLGKRQKFLVSGGIMGAKVDRLGNGLEVGDQYLSDSNTLPLVSSYELGYFVSVSYDLTSR